MAAHRIKWSPYVCMMTNSTCYKNTKEMKVKGILWHDTGCNNPWLSRYVQTTDGKFADGTVGTVQTMPWNYRPWGCGSGSKGSCNDGWIQFEICEDAKTDKEYAQKVWNEAILLTAWLCE